MEKYIPVLKRSQLFSGVSEEEISVMLSCLNAKVRTYQKGEIVFRQGEHISCITVLAAGNLHIRRDDFWGNRSIIQHIGAGEMFGEAYMAPESGAILNDVAAAADSTVIFFDVKRILTTCSSACRFHAMVVQNLFFAISEKNRKLVQKLGHMAKRTTREKLLSYLSDEARRHSTAVSVILRNSILFPRGWRFFFVLPAAGDAMRFESIEEKDSITAVRAAAAVLQQRRGSRNDNKKNAD